MLEFIGYLKTNNSHIDIDELFITAKGELVYCDEPFGDEIDITTENIRGYINDNKAIKCLYRRYTCKDILK